MDIVEKAKRFAEYAHKDIKRKYTDKPYFVHLERVKKRVSRLKDSTPAMEAASYVHDTVEDVPWITHEIIEEVFGEEIAIYVREMTNPSKGLDLSRPEKKKMDREHLKKVSINTKKIKLVDRIDNILDSFNAIGIDDDFVRIYVSESLLLAEVLRDADEELYMELITACGYLLRKVEENRK